MKIRRAVPEDVQPLTDIWCRSVRATHDFLSDDDVQSLEPVVREQVIPALETWVLVSASGVQLGFIALSGRAVEALFVDPPAFGKGGGTLLLTHARQQRMEPLAVDVNEQNPGALGFYKSAGFEVVGRSPTDGQGRPFPLLHLRQGRR